MQETFLYKTRMTPVKKSLLEQDSWPVYSDEFTKQRPVQKLHTIHLDRLYYTLPIDGIVPLLKFYTSNSFEFDQAAH